MTATSNLTSKQGITRNSIPARKDNEDANPQGSLIMALVLVSVLAAIGGIVFTFLKKRKLKQEIKDVDEE